MHLSTQGNLLMFLKGIYLTLLVVEFQLEHQLQGPSVLQQDVPSSYSSVTGDIKVRMATGSEGSGSNDGGRRARALEQRDNALQCLEQCLEQQRDHKFGRLERFLKKLLTISRL
ncbi:hypothetical protein P3X46_011655 [Hevea brasiliensis]|uniref:Uncharacterized protein n=1 Tax=Hevea brasiliensis TaxID=3981 RepID=A0ABQ9MBL4_HEVBR|nr:hypothetical protein P3X46_011655 [Hevea brasiliensis]